MKFLRNLFAAILGFLIGVLILFFLLFIIGTVASTISNKDVKIKKNTFLLIQFKEPIVDRASDDFFNDIDFTTAKLDKKLGLNEILRNIEKAKHDDNISGIYMNISHISSSFGGWASVEEIRNKLIEFKESGKPIYVYNGINLFGVAAGFSEIAYYLSTIADSIFMNPESILQLDGLGGNAVFFTKTAKKLGLAPQIIRVGKYKAAVEPYMLEKMSKENREQKMKYINSIWDHVVNEISKTRDIDKKYLISHINETPIHMPEIAIKNKFIDGVKYEDEIITLLRNKTNVEKGKKPNLVSLSKYAGVVSKKRKKGKEKIAIVYAQGDIGFADDSKNIGPGLAKTLRKIREDDKIKAVVLRINSPGGSAMVSDLIWREIDLLKKEKKPVIASMGNVAASGGYYIACPADTIVASGNTITGSIGVFGLFFSGKDLYENKMHLSFDEIKTNKHANFLGGNPLGLPFTTRALNDDEKTILQNYVNDTYDTFIKHVSDGRNIPIEKVKEIAEGRVWIGKDAHELGLIDVIGGLETAIQIAKEKAGIKSYKIVEYPIIKNPFQKLMENFSSGYTQKILKKELGVQYKYYKIVNEMLKRQGIQARLPYDIDIQ